MSHAAIVAPGRIAVDYGTAPVGAGTGFFDLPIDSGVTGSGTGIG